MDRRTLLFVISLTLALWGVNWFFESRGLEEKREWLEKKNALESKKIEELSREINRKTVKPGQLPIIKIEEPLKYAIAFDSYLFAEKHMDAPKTLEAKGNTYEKQVEQAPGFIIYAKEDPKALNIPSIPHFGHWDLQIISLAPEPQILFATIDDGHFSIPLHELNELKGEPKKEVADSLVVQKTKDGWAPVAFYIADTESLLYLNQLSSLTTEVKAIEISSEEAKESFYVLENDTLQLVFSNIGGAVTEINLPFTSKRDEASVVKEIDFDRDIIDDSPQNARFPLHPYFTPGNSKEHPEGKLGGYYPLLRRDLILGGMEKSIRVLPRYYAFNLVSEYPEMAQLPYKVAEFTENSITFKATQKNRTITKTYQLDDKAPYVVNLSINIEGDSRGIWLTSGVPEVEWISGASTPVMKYRTTRRETSEVVIVDKPEDATVNTSARPDWIGNSNGFLGMILDPLSEIENGFRAQKVSGTTMPSRLILIDERYHRFKSQDLPGYLMMLPLTQKGGSANFRLYAGPFATSTLKEVDATFSNATTGYNPDYLAIQTFHGWFAFISAPFAKLLFFLMNFFHQLTGSWGFSIILLTVALRVMLYPLNAWSARSTAKMQAIGPQVQKLQEKYKKDPTRAKLEVMNLYRDQGVNPVSGCFPMLIQMPFLIGMFDLLKSTFELRGASFIPGWIDDLSQPDILFSWGVPIPFFGTAFHLLPVLLGAVMFLQQRLMATGPSEPSQMTDQQRQQRTMGTMMAVVFSVMFYHFPSGLNLYWISSMLLGFGQQWWTMKRTLADKRNLPKEANGELVRHK